MFNSPELPKPDYRKAEREANRLLREAGVFQPPVNPVQIAQNLELNVEFVAFSGESAEVSGLFDFDSRTIMVNREDPGNRQTFTIAHELGHSVMHGEWAKTAAYRVLWRDLRKQAKDRYEMEANAFAGCLLMPRDLMDRYKSLPVASLADLFAVSQDAIRARLSILYGY